MPSGCACAHLQSGCHMCCAGCEGVLVILLSILTTFQSAQLFSVAPRGAVMPCSIGTSAGTGFPERKCASPCNVCASALGLKRRHARHCVEKILNALRHAIGNALMYIHHLWAYRPGDMVSLSTCSSDAQSVGPSSPSMGATSSYVGPSAVNNILRQRYFETYLLIPPLQEGLVTQRLRMCEVLYIIQSRGTSSPHTNGSVMHVRRGVWSIVVVLLWCCSFNLVLLCFFRRWRLGLAGIALAGRGQGCFRRRHAQVVERRREAGQQRLHQQRVHGIIARLQNHTNISSAIVPT